MYFKLYRKLLVSSFVVMLVVALAIPVLAQDQPPAGTVTAIPFAAPDDAAILNPVFTWQPGTSAENTYQIGTDGALVIFGAPGTNYWGTDRSAPLVTYPISGDFTTQVKVVAQPGETFHVAALGVRSAFDAEKFIRADLFMNNNQLFVDAAVNGSAIINTLYSGDTVYLKIERHQSLFSIDYSFDGGQWLRLTEYYAYALPAEVEIFLSAFSTATQQFVARFYDFSVSTPPLPAAQPAPAPNVISFGAADNPAVLNPVLVWQPGTVETNAYELRLDGGLTIFGSPYTNQWGTDRSAPLMIYPITGNFVTQVKIVGNPRETYHVAAFGVRSADDADRFIRATFAMNSGRILAEAAINGGGINGTVFFSDTIYFRIERQQTLHTISYSYDGIHWVTLTSKYEYDLPAEVEIYLSAYSTTLTTFPVDFYDFTVVAG